MNRILTVIAALLLPAATTAAGGAHGFVLGERNGLIERLDLLTLESSGGPSLKLPAEAWSFSPDGSELAVGADSKSAVHLIDPAGPTLVADVPLGGGHAVATVWSASRLIVLVRTCHPTCVSRAVVIDPRKRRVTRSTPVPGAVADIASAPGALVVLASPEHGIGTSRIESIAADGTVRVRALPGVRSGSVLIREKVTSGYPIVDHELTPGLAVSADGRTAAVVSNDGLLLVALPSLRVEGHRPLRTPANAAAPQPDGYTRDAAWAGTHELVVWGEDDHTSVGANGLQDRQSSGGVTLVDVENWHERALSRTASTALVAGARILVYEAGAAGSGTGLTVFTPRGHRLFHLFASEPIVSVETAGSRAFVERTSPNAYTVVDLERGRVAAVEHGTLPVLLD